MLASSLKLQVAFRRVQYALPGSATFRNKWAHCKFHQVRGVCTTPRSGQTPPRMQNFFAWCSLQGVSFPKLGLKERASDVVHTSIVSSENSFAFEQMTAEELRENLEEIGLPTSGENAELLDRLTKAIEQAVDEASDSERSDANNSSVGAGVPFVGCSSSEIVIVPQQRLSEGVYAAVPFRLAMCKHNILKTHAGIHLKLPWPKKTVDEIMSRQQMLEVQFEEIFCVSVFLIAQHRDQNSQWRGWLDLLPQPPSASTTAPSNTSSSFFNALYVSEQQLHVLRGSHVAQEIQYIQQLLEEWYELYIGSERINDTLLLSLSQSL